MTLKTLAVFVVLAALLPLIGCATNQDEFRRTGAGDAEAMRSKPAASTALAGEAIDELPEAVQSSLSRDFPGARVVSVRKLTEQGQPYYRVKFFQANGPAEAAYTPSGQRLPAQPPYVTVPEYREMPAKVRPMNRAKP